MSVSGEWVLNFDWGCSGAYAQSSITFSSDGTFTSPPTETGEWVESDGKIMWRFDHGPAIYSGDVVDAAMTGISTTFQGLNGCWYAVQSGSTSQAAAARKAEHDIAGNKAG